MPLIINVQTVLQMSEICEKLSKTVRQAVKYIQLTITQDKEKSHNLKMEQRELLEFFLEKNDFNELIISMVADKLSAKSKLMSR